MTNESVSDVLDTATEVTGGAAQDVNQFFQLIQDNIPNIVGFGIRKQADQMVPEGCPEIV